MNIDLIGNLAGLILAHSALIGSGQDGQAIAPYAIYQKAENREVVNYPAESQAIAVENMQTEISEYQHAVDAWASVQEGYISLDDDTQLDIYLVKIWAVGLKEPLKIYQAFEPMPFKLRGNIKVMNYEETGLDLMQSEKFHSALDEGINSHETAGKKWDSWF